MKANKILIISLTLNAMFLVSLIVGGIVFADTNGVWHNSEDVRSGTFGTDEADGEYVFENPVEFNNEIRVNSIKSSSGGNVVIQLG